MESRLQITAGLAEKERRDGASRVHRIPNELCSLCSGLPGLPGPQHKRWPVDALPHSGLKVRSPGCGCNWRAPLSRTVTFQEIASLKPPSDHLYPETRAWRAWTQTANNGHLFYESGGVTNPAQCCATISQHFYPTRSFWWDWSKHCDGMFQLLAGWLGSPAQARPAWTSFINIFWETTALAVLSAFLDWAGTPVCISNDLS